MKTLESSEELLDAIRRALREDIGPGDITTQVLIDDASRTRAEIVARDACVVSGGEAARRVFLELDPAMSVTHQVADGTEAGAGQRLILLEGCAAAILKGERTALNFMQRMSGIATLTKRFVDKARPHGVVILDTRKTTPNLRWLEKYAVVCGGGENHRMGLYDRVLIKDNHRKLWHEEGRFSLADAVLKARERFPGVVIEVEVESEAELEDVLQACPDWVLLDNMPPDRLRRCVERCAGRCRLEASGGITLKSVADVAATGVDAISLGCLTHSAPAADLSLEFIG